MKRIHVIVTGRVQGVGFRFFTQQVATEHEITGWVKNLTNGDVEIEAQASSNNLDAFLKKLKKGPGLFASVKDTKIDQVESIENEDSFRILY
ncbi:acylphosphatase [Saliterribacillus persicus]|uniref:acylphosphatase n=1 Tax=Saliterribacillus persicus TaxID=930114 RepID=UPI000DF27851|nr:acylphosphatase [Saliterribacillus persicus]